MAGSRSLGSRAHAIWDRSAQLADGDLYRVGGGVVRALKHRAERDGAAMFLGGRERVRLVVLVPRERYRRRQRRAAVPLALSAGRLYGRTSRQTELNL